MASSPRPQYAADAPLAADDAALQASFEREGLGRCRRGARIFCGFVLALLAVSAAYSRLVEPAIFAPLLRIRLAAIAGVAVILWLLGTALGERRPRELTVALMVIVSLSLHELAEPTGGQLSPQYDRLTLVILGSAILMSWNAAWAALACAGVMAVYIGGSAVAGGLGAAPFLGNLGRLLAASLVTIGGNAVRERLRWRELWHTHSLSEARRRAEEEIRRLNQELEQRVLDRTAMLRTSEERFRAMFEAAPIGVTTVGPDGRLLQANRALAAMLGFEPDVLIGRPLGELVAADDRERSARAHDELRSGRQPGFQMETRYRRRDGEEIATHQAVAAIVDDAGRFLYALAMIADVTERLRAQRQAREHQEHLAHVLRVATMGGMVAELAHELNQPLGAIVNFANGTGQRLRRSGADPELSDAVALIAAEGMRAAEIIRRVRDFVRPGGVQREIVDPNLLVREAAHLIEEDARRHQILLRLQLDPAVPAISLDLIQVEQVILNLLRNAIEAMGAAPGRDHELVVQTVPTAHDGVEVRVRDTGDGVPPGATDRIFDAFFTTKPGGLGMGLAISRSIVEANGGRLWASGNADRGMTFAFSLPTGPPADSAALGG